MINKCINDVLQLLKSSQIIKFLYHMIINKVYNNEEIYNIICMINKHENINKIFKINKDLDIFHQKMEFK